MSFPHAHMMQRAAALVACLLGACGSDRSAGTPRAANAEAAQSSAPGALVPASTEQAGRDACPLEIPTSSLIAQPLENGAALWFTTRGDVDALRRGVARLASPPGLPAPRLDKVQNGIRIVFDAPSPSETAKLQAAVAQHARDLAKRCRLIPAAPEEDESENETTPAPFSPPPRMPSSPPPPAAPKPAADAGASTPKPDHADAGAREAKPAPRDNQEKIKPAPPGEKLDAGGHLPDASPRP